MPGLGKITLTLTLTTLSLDADDGLRSLTDDRIADVKRLMNQKGFRGVPLLLVTVDSTEHIISGHDLYGGAKSISEALAKLA